MSENDRCMIMRRSFLMQKVIHDDYAALFDALIEKILIGLPANLVNSIRKSTR